MNDRALKRRAIADKLSADVERLTKEIADRRRHLNHAKANLIQKRIAKAYLEGKELVDNSGFASWSKHVMPLAKAIGKLHRARTRLILALDKAEVAAMLAREERDRRERIARVNASILSKPSQLGGIDARFARERIQEDRRIRHLKKKLAKRTTKDQTARPDWMARPKRLPDPVQQPDLSLLGKDTYDEPPRDGLLPGEFRIMDRPRNLIDRPRAPTVWTATYVGVRLIEAHKVLSRSPGGTIYPKGFGEAWPAYKAEATDVAVLDATRPRYAPSSEAVARMNEAISWPMQFLASRPGAAADVNWWAYDAAWEQMAFDTRSAPWELLQVIANGLNAANEVVT